MYVYIDRYTTSLSHIIDLNYSGKKIVITFVGLDNGTNSLCRYVLDWIDQAIYNKIVWCAKYNASVYYVYSIYWIKYGESTSVCVCASVNDRKIAEIWLQTILDKVYYSHTPFILTIVMFLVYCIHESRLLFIVRVTYVACLANQQR